MQHILVALCNSFFTKVLRCASLILALLLCVLCTGCSRAPSSALVWTDIPELVIAAQLFNRENDRFAIDIAYKDNVAIALTQTSVPPSLVIGKYLLSSPLMKRFVAMDALFTDYFIDPNDFYPALLSSAIGRAAPACAALV